jgi:hypothetical protein
MAIWKKSIGKERKQDKFRQCQELVPRQREARSSGWVSIGPSCCGTVAAYLNSKVMFSSEPPRVLIGGPALVWDT